MKVFVPLLALLGACSASPELHSKWSSFKAAHGKSYSPSLEAARLEAFSANVRLIEAHNARFERGEETYKLGLNALSDLTAEEKASKRGAVVNRAARARVNATSFDPSRMPSAPSYIDWRGKAVSSVKDQDQCGSCYTFSAAGAIESGLMKKGEREYDLSEQQLVDCSYGIYDDDLNFGCDGGDPCLTIQHAISKGIVEEKDYPYTSGQSEKHGRCRRSSGNVPSVSRLRIKNVRSGDENALASALVNGPIAITLNGENNEFYNYESGIYNNKRCKTEPDHAVLLVGFGKKDGQEYWIIKNSWGPTWGENGFMRMAKGFNRCGIVTEDSYYVV